MAALGSKQSPSGVGKQRAKSNRIQKSAVRISNQNRECRNQMTPSTCLFWERRYGTRTTHGVAGDEDSPRRALRKLGKTGRHRSAKYRTTNGSAQAVKPQPDRFGVQSF